MVLPVPAGPSSSSRPVGRGKRILRAVSGSSRSRTNVRRSRSTSSSPTRSSQLTGWTKGRSFPPHPLSAWRRSASTILLPLAAARNAARSTNAFNLASRCPDHEVAMQSAYVGKVSQGPRGQKTDLAECLLVHRSSRPHTRHKGPRGFHARLRAHLSGPACAPEVHRRLPTANEFASARREEPPC